MSERKAVVRTLVAATAVVAAGLAAIYGFGNRQGNTETPSVTAASPRLAHPDELVAATLEGAAGCEDAVATADRLDPLARGELAAFNVADNPVSLRHFTFRRPDGTPVTIADFAGKTVLLNFWAVWCVPCRVEMPAIDRLATTIDDDDFTVVAVAVDLAAPARSQAFLDEIGVRLPLYVDQTLGLLDQIQQVGAIGGLPTTILINPAGCELGMIQGPALWDSPEAVALVRAAIGG